MSQEAASRGRDSADTVISNQLQAAPVGGALRSLQLGQQQSIKLQASRSHSACVAEHNLLTSPSDLHQAQVWGTRCLAVQRLLPQCTRNGGSLGQHRGRPHTHNWQLHAGLAVTDNSQLAPALRWHGHHWRL